MRMTGYKVRLRAWFRRDGQQWIVWCPALDVMTQSRTRKRALESLREAVELWFESCTEREVLDGALNELGFAKAAHSEALSPDADQIKIIEDTTQQFAGGEKPSFSVARDRGADCIEGIIPAHIAAEQLGGVAFARD